MARYGIPPSPDRVTFERRLGLVLLGGAVVLVLGLIQLLVIEPKNSMNLEQGSPGAAPADDAAAHEKAEALVAAKQRLLFQLDRGQIQDVTWVDERGAGENGAYRFVGELIVKGVDEKIRSLHYSVSVHLDAQRNWTLDDYDLSEKE